jgi:hypothetical protein
VGRPKEMEGEPTNLALAEAMVVVVVEVFEWSTG